MSASLGAALVTAGVGQPWLKVDPAAAFAQALKPGTLNEELSNRVLFVFGQPVDEVRDSPQALEVARALGVSSSGWGQNHYLAAALGAAALITIVAVTRSVFATSAWAARRHSPLIALAGLASLGIAAVALWVLAPDPRQAMRPDTGLWLITGGGGLMLLGALTLGNNRRRPWIDELATETPMKRFDNTEHLAYSHGAWVPKLPDDH
ncbi:MAG: hypothetical protein Q7T55_09715 [Solirubrobacteraceae bacterium]|nr:hypothetical protein [Solirubrobacteraceae bacterium]